MTQFYSITEIMPTYKCLLFKTEAALFVIKCNGRLCYTFFLFTSTNYWICSVKEAVKSDRMSALLHYGGVADCNQCRISRLPSSLFANVSSERYEY